MANKKVRFGLRGAKYAIYNASENTYGDLKDIEGSVSLSTSSEGGDSSDFYADDSVFYSFAGTNGGYSLELEVAHASDQLKADLLGEVVDTATGVQYEQVGVEPAQFALMFEVTVGGTQKGYVYYNCKASRVEMSANTTGENPDVDTDTLNIRAIPMEFTIDGAKVGVVQSHIEKTSDNTTKYNAFFQSVVVPGATA